MKEGKRKSGVRAGAGGGDGQEEMERDSEELEETMRVEN